MGTLLQTGTGGGAGGLTPTWTAPQRIRAQWWSRRPLGLAERDAAGDTARVGGGGAVLPFLPIQRGRRGDFF